ncbi:glycosyltransferase BC10-like isoform X2 [Macadamia integrifolia]|uniref:glycosyltransferase BC10-like isoform X2 n=1 Tax=Macadamia integrifolia TaxID=60698 RepID=UPI001C4E85B4|nr:glycosyltransferase BC10-like isoform X2 [Macadamia integrifolia]
MKRRNSISKSHSRWNKKLLAVLFLSFCFGCLVLMQARYDRIRMIISSPPPFVQRPKIAFLFIARNRLPLEIVWDAFFQVDWGEASMIQAERILLKNALMDSFNERFVFLSDSCLPLYGFSYTYDYIMSTPNSFVDSFADTKEGRYNPKMHPVIPVHNWRKGSQWVVLRRKHAEVVVEDDMVYPVFQQHCRRKSLPEFWRDHPLPADGSKEHNCIPDEHYVQTLLAQKGLEGEITRRTLTHTSWDLSSSKVRERRGWHPVTYKMSDATAEVIQSIKDIDNINYETESRKEWCSSKGKPAHCFLFARKFTRSAGLRLLNESVLGVSNEGIDEA